VIPVLQPGFQAVTEIRLFLAKNTSRILPGKTLLKEEIPDREA
jgi:hypothetical protein